MYAAEAQQDALRPIRNFVSLLGGALYEQSLSGQDGMAYNTPYNYQTVSPLGVAVTGLPISTTPAGGVVISPAVVMLCMGMAVVAFWKLG